MQHLVTQRQQRKLVMIAGLAFTIYTMTYLFYIYPQIQSARLINDINKLNQEISSQQQQIELSQNKILSDSNLRMLSS